MSLNNWVRRLMTRPLSTRKSSPIQKKSQHIGRGLEHLEDRVTPAILPLDAGEAIVANTANNEAVPDVAMKPDGTGFVVAWQAPDAGGGPGDDFGIYFRRYDANWQPLGGAVLANTIAFSTQNDPSIGIDAAGNFVITWAANNFVAASTQRDIVARRFLANGTPIDTNEFLVSTNITAGTQFNADVGVDPASGRFSIAWGDASTGLFTDDVYIRGFTGITAGGDGNPTAAYGIVQVNNPAASTADQGNPRVALDAAGNAVVAFDSFGQDGSQMGVYFRRLTAAGAHNGGEVPVNTVTAGVQQSPDIGMDGAGNFVIVWEADNVDGSGTAVVMQRYNAAAVAQGGNVQVNTFTTNGQFGARVNRASGGDYVVSWTGNEADGDPIGFDTFYKKYDTAGNTLIAETVLNVATASDDNLQRDVVPAINNAGDFALVWGDVVAGVGDIKIRRFGEAPIVSHAAASSNPSEAVGNAPYTVSRTGAAYVLSLVSTAVSVTRTGGTATPATDFTTTFPATVTIPAGSSSLVANVAIVNDTLFEGNETILLGLGASANYTVGGGAAHTMTIVDNDAAPVLTINDATLTEGDAGSTNMVFTVTLTGATGLASSVNFTTAPGSALAGTDYTTTSGTLNFGAGAGPQTLTISVPILGNTIFQANRQFVVNLTGATNATIGDPQGTGTIVDDDAPATISISSGNNQTTFANTSFASPLVALVRNANNNPVQGVSVVFTAPAAGASSVFSTTTNTITVVSNASGLASTGSFSANGTSGGPYSVSSVATDGTNPSVNFSLTNDPAPSTGSLNVTLSSGTLTVTDTVNNPNSVSAIVSGTDLVLNSTVEEFSTGVGTVSNGNLTLTIPLASVSALVMSLNGGDDAFTLDYSGGNFPFGVTYAGGTAGDDSLVTTGGTVATATHTFTAADSGTIAYAGNGLLTYSGLEPVDETGMVVASRVFNQPAGGSAATLANSGANLLLSSAPVTFEEVLFAPPATSLTINRGNAADTLTTNSLTNLTSAFTVGTAVAPFAVINNTGTINLGTNALAEFAARIGVTGNVTAGNVTLDADTGAGVAGNFVGLTINNAQVLGSGVISLEGRGGASGR